MAADQVIRWTTAGAVIGVAAVAAVASYEHAYALVRAHCEAGWTARLVPLTVDGLIYASSMVMLDCARRKVAVPALARWLLGPGIAATLAANVAHGLGHGLIGAAVAAWPAVALVGSYELLMMIIRSAKAPGTVTALCGVPECMPDIDPLQERLQLRIMAPSRWRPARQDRKPAQRAGAQALASRTLRSHQRHPHTSRRCRLDTFGPAWTHRQHLNTDGGLQGRALLPDLGLR
jgi:hypothetical protein